ncbi:MAG: polyprenyl diphosphate synthase [Candidatus Bathyarchaeia archaeon]
MLRRFLQLFGAYKLYERWLLGQVRSKEKPRHVAVILDGNRRWASKRALPLIIGHREGAKRAEDFLEWCLELGIKTVTLYAFSTENFKRTREEVEAVLSIVEEQVRKLREDPRIHKNHVRVKALGRLDILPESLRKALNEVEELTREYESHFLNIAVAYGGRAEIIDAVKKIVEEVSEGRLNSSHIDEAVFDRYLYTAHLPNPYPDLIIRTSGEERLSGFLLWQSAYSELLFLDVYWPDLRKIDLLRAIRTYQQRRRRFGA